MGTAMRRLRALSMGDRVRLLGLMMVLPITSASLRLVGYKRSLALTERLSQHPQRRPASPSDIEGAQMLARLAAIAGRRGLVDATCLRQALAIHLVLRRRGLDPRLKLGVDRREAQPDMHAWVELDGLPLAQPELRHQAF